MVLIIILLSIVILTSLINTVRYTSPLSTSLKRYYTSKVEVFFDTFITMLLFTIAFYIFSQVLLGVLNTKSENVTYSQQLVSVNDGTGVDGKVSGSIFIISGKVEDTQHFSYYVKETNGSYRLDKRSAQKSSIWQDSTPETARVDVTDTISKCNTTWYSTFCFKTPTELVHADFHIPANSIKEDFVLDAR